MDIMKLRRAVLSALMVALSINCVLVGSWGRGDKRRINTRGRSLADGDGAHARRGKTGNDNLHASR